MIREEGVEGFDFSEKTLENFVEVIDLILDNIVLLKLNKTVFFF